MKYNTKHTTAALLLFTTIVPSLVVVAFLLYQSLWRFQSEERLEKEKLTTISVTASNFTWIKKGKEIQVGGELFDVKSFTKQGDRHLFTGIYDHEELSIKNLLAATTSNSDNKLSSIFPFLLLVAVIPAKRDTIFSFTIHKHFNFFTSNTLIRSGEVASPPPRLFTTIR